MGGGGDFLQYLRYIKKLKRLPPRRVASHTELGTATIKAKLEELKYFFTQLFI